MKAILVTIRANVRGRPLQTGVVLLLTLLAGAMAAGSLTVLTKASESYDIALERLTGPHLLFTWNAELVTPAQLMATSHLPGITGTGQVHPVAVVPVELGTDKFVIEIVGRDSIYEAVDGYQLLEGRWPERPGEIAVTGLQHSDWSFARVAIGDRMSVLSRADRPSFVVVGKVAGMPRSPARAFVRSDDVASLTDSGSYPHGLRARVSRRATRDRRVPGGLHGLHPGGTAAGSRIRDGRHLRGAAAREDRQGQPCLAAAGVRPAGPRLRGLHRRQRRYRHDPGEPARARHHAGRRLLPRGRSSSSWPAVRSSQR